MRKTGAGSFLIFFASIVLMGMGAAVRAIPIALIGMFLLVGWFIWWWLA